MNVKAPRSYKLQLLAGFAAVKSENPIKLVRKHVEERNSYDNRFIEDLVLYLC